MVGAQESSVDNHPCSYWDWFQIFISCRLG